MHHLELIRECSTSAIIMRPNYSFLEVVLGRPAAWSSHSGCQKGMAWSGRRCQRGVQTSRQKKHDFSEQISSTKRISFPFPQASWQVPFWLRTWKMLRLEHYYVTSNNLAPSYLRLSVKKKESTFLIRPTWSGSTVSIPKSLKSLILTTMIFMVTAITYLKDDEF